MFFKDEERRESFCNNGKGADGCGNVDHLLPEEFDKQCCSQCGKKTIKAHTIIGREITCPAGHDHISREDKHCIVCGGKLKVERKSIVREF